MASTKLPLTTWFLAIYLLSQAKTGLSALALKRQLGVSYPTAWLINYKLMTAMAEREARYMLAGLAQLDDAYLGGERAGGKRGRGSENKIPFVAAVSLTEGNRPLRVKLNRVSGFTLQVITDWSRAHLAAGCTVYSDGLACFSAVAMAGCDHQRTVVAGRKPKDLQELQWVNTILGNLKTSLSGTYHAFNFSKYADRYLAAFAYRFNRRFDLDALAIALADGTPCIFNTDQGSQFTSSDFTNRLIAEQILISMNGRGRALDNVFIERLWRSVKYEDIYLRDYGSVPELEQGLAEYFRFYNHERPHSSLGGRTPAEAHWSSLLEQE